MLEAIVSKENPSKFQIIEFFDDLQKQGEVVHYFIFKDIIEIIDEYLRMYLLNDEESIAHIILKFERFDVVLNISNCFFKDNRMSNLPIAYQVNRFSSKLEGMSIQFVDINESFVSCKK